MDIAENSIASGAQNIKVNVQENTVTDRLSMSIQDDGSGMDDDQVRSVSDPFVTSRTTRKVGLGIPLLKAAAESCNGDLTITSTRGKGTRILCHFQRSHIDRMPLGDLVSTILMLVISYPAVHWVFRYEFNDELFEFDDEFFKSELGNISLSEPQIITFLKDHLREGITGVMHTIQPV
jgi:hypothetical protein